MTRFTADQEDAIARLVAGLPGRDLVCIGATAVDQHVSLFRRTNDVDFVLRAHPDELLGLIEPLGFERSTKIPHRFRTDLGTLVDLLPCDDESLARGFVEFEAGTPMSVVGFDLVRTHHRAIRLERTGATVAIADLAVLVVLKVISFLDRPAERERDLADLNRIFDGALADDDPRRWEGMLWNSGIAHEHQSALFVGSEVGAIVTDSHRIHIERFLCLVSEPGHAHFARMLRSSGFVGMDPEGRLTERLEAFRKGLSAKSDDV